MRNTKPRKRAKSMKTVNGTALKTRRGTVVTTKSLPMMPRAVTTMTAMTARVVRRRISL